jgi:hypothetical protein
MRETVIHSWGDRTLVDLGGGRGEYRSGEKTQQFDLRGKSIFAELCRAAESLSILRQEMGNLRAVYHDEGLDIEPGFLDDL